MAEAGVQMGFPEVIFNMFPGMGAYSFLSRRLNPVLVERMIMSGKMYSAEEFHELGLVDVLAKRGEGEREVRRYIHRMKRKSNTLRGLLAMRELVNPVSYEELKDITGLWVEAALSLGEQELSAMEWLLRGQNRRLGLEGGGAEQKVVTTLY